MGIKKRIRKYGQKAKKLAKSELRAFWFNAPIDERTVLFESYGGNGISCHPEAIFRYLLESEEFSTLKFIWVLSDFRNFRSVINEFKGSKRVSFVKYLSVDYYRVIHTSKYLVNNVSFPTQFAKREGQVYLNTWHGVPLKKMGYDIAGRSIDAKNIIRNFLASDYLISSSPAMTQRMYVEAFKLQPIYTGAIIEEGNPRTDYQYSEEKAFANARLDGLATKIVDDQRKVVLYAPTWKGESYFNPHNDTASIAATIKKIESTLDLRDYKVLIKAHQLVADALFKDISLRPYLVDNGLPTNLVLKHTDVLITDYSSIFFDFLNSQRPIIFYTPDLADYKEYRDLYHSVSELPGMVAVNEAELIASIELSVKKSTELHKFIPQHAKFAQDYVASDDGSSTGRVVDIVFRKNTRNHSIKRFNYTTKKRLLVYAGGMIPNGITTSAINLLDNIDYEKYDVTVLCPYSSKKDQQYNISQINSNARVMFRFGTFNGSYIQNRLRSRILRKGLSSFGSHSRSQQRLWEREWRRCFGNAEFDHMIDFSGYTPFWGLLFMHGPDSQRSIWLHNDLASDAYRSIQGSTPLKNGLFATFSIYKYFDNLVSVSSGLSEINRESLSRWAPHTKFLWASNTINSSKIESLSREAFLVDENQNLSYPKICEEDRSRFMTHQVAKLLEKSSAGPSKLHLRGSAEETSVPIFTFFTAGRLSPEKNHLRLIRSFDVVHNKLPNTRLVIAGDGPLRAALQSEIDSRGLSNAVKLVGHTKNPYSLMGLSDAFVLSSDYEGQPMVLLEALVLGVPVITTSFGSVQGALPPGIGKIVEPDDTSLANAMMDHVMHPVDRRIFDVARYNSRAIEEFEKIIDS